MKVAYIFLSPGAGLQQLIYTILPELEAGVHPLDVVGMCFFDDNSIALDPHNQIGQRLTSLGRALNIVMMKGSKADLTVNAPPGAYEDPLLNGRRSPTECAVITVTEGKETGCFPDLYTAMAGNKPDRIISL